MSASQEYVLKYYESYAEGEVDFEMETVGNFLIENVQGKALDCGCGPVPQLWSIFMPNLAELHAVDLPQESIDFVLEKTKHVNDWKNDFSAYQNVVEKKIGKLAGNYVSSQVLKLKSVSQADISKSFPFAEGSFDTVMSLYSLGCLNDEQELKNAVANMARVLKKGGTFLHVNTNGNNKNDQLRAYTWNGLDQTTKKIEDELESLGFSEINVQIVPVKNAHDAMYKYDEIMLLKAVKK